MSGLMSITGKPKQGTMRAGIAISDTSAGMFLGQAILLALLHRERSGEGQWVHTSLLESMLCKRDFQGSRYTMESDIPEQQGNFHPTQVPMGVFEAKDGHVNLAASTTKMWRNFCECLEADELLNNQSYSTSSLSAENRLSLHEDIAILVRECTKEFLVTQLNKVGVPYGSICNVGEAFEDKQSKQLQITKTAYHPSLRAVNLVRSPITLSACELPKNFHHAGPSPGEQLVEQLIEQLIEQGVIT
ncbi:MAG: crotonobetainyl-CoA:carnitine CoA-transferase CaiB-like acyl-CoA transferase [Candidatus Azotimanducaceae bacterium]|jgi:crotonobetainyl-CoA:carnitine CoA-transferase CaiB-like acyl-CoA transferase